MVLPTSPIKGLVNSRLENLSGQKTQDALLELIGLQIISPATANKTDGGGVSGASPDADEDKQEKAKEVGEEENEENDSEEEGDVVGVAYPYLELTEKSNGLLQVGRLVIRDCYVDVLKRGKCAFVAGTLGIGKSMFGLLLLRAIVLEGDKTVVYWDKDKATAFSFCETMKARYGLNQEFDVDLKAGTKTLYMVTWESNQESLENFLMDDDVLVIHDPSIEYTKAGLKNGKTSTVFVLSYGHGLMDEWIRKSCGPPTKLYMPCFQKSEILANKDNLFCDREEDWKVNMEGSIESAFKTFGGSIRYYGRDDSQDFWEAMQAKVERVLSENGRDIAKRTINFRGSIRHVEVDFDKSKPLFPEKGHNRFEKEGYVLGSDGITQRSVQDMKNIMKCFSGEPGVETVYGVLFETYAHRLFRESINEGPRAYKMKVVTNDGGKNNKPEFTEVPFKAEEHIHLAGMDPSKLSEEFSNRANAEISAYFQPEVSNFPTYDAVLIVSGETVGLEYDKVALLLQMTVSGVRSETPTET
ncbi:unknown protein [Seminavis robusta]|uniref:Uncharacterized protein n=1 Tax=Seminavis robusta TaxID=568900 RepID=A0A9N8H2Q8_9STRA|nr:unknown protein [Seminavis robusta]|eukprot:Sro42_g025390.1 n/a (527) ;mRNA; r:10178-11758